MFSNALAPTDVTATPPMVDGRVKVRSIQPMPLFFTKFMSPYRYFVTAPAANVKHNSSTVPSATCVVPLYVMEARGLPSKGELPNDATVPENTTLEI